MVTTTELGKLEFIDPRQIWLKEDRDLTPWIRENLDRLSEAIGIEISSEIPPEVTVGSFSLDVLAEDERGRPVIIENQLEPTDHTHLGQLLVLCVWPRGGCRTWVARRFRDEHRAAIDWLNERTDDKVDFFGIRSTRSANRGFTTSTSF
jgi:hypothetical protein